MAVKRLDPLEPPKADTWHIDEILRLARRGELLVPIFQRNFVWRREDVINFFDSLYRGYPVGNLLIWETEPPPGAQARFGPLTFESTKGRAQLVIDGQQRITSLVATCLGGGKTDSRFDLFFDLEEGKIKGLGRLAEPPRTWLPLNGVLDTVSFLEWLQSRKPAFDRAVTDQANLVVKALRDYRVPVYLVRSRNENAVREIFRRLNRTGRALKSSEIFGALHRGRSPGIDIHGLGTRLADLKFGILDADWLLKALAAVRDEPTIKNLREAEPTEKLRKESDRTLDALARVVQFLRQDAQVLHWELLPYRFPLLPLTKLFDRCPNPSQRARRTLVSWLWRGVSTGQHYDTRHPTVKAALECVSDDPERSATALLNTLPDRTARFEMRHHDFRAAATKLVCGVLARKEPLHLQNGSQLDVLALMTDGEIPPANAWLPILPQKAVKNKRGTENRLLHPKIHGPVRRAIELADHYVLDSHLISPEALVALQGGVFEQFLTLRRERIENEVRSFLEQMGA